MKTTSNSEVPPIPFSARNLYSKHTIVNNPDKLAYVLSSIFLTIITGGAINLKTVYNISRKNML